MNTLENDLMIQNWSIYKEQDIDKAYEKFPKIFNLLYDKNCPIKKYSNIHKQTNSPWVTKN